MTPQSSPVPIYGDVKWRGKCHLEAVEQASFFNQLRKVHPNTWGILAVHPRNEGLVRDGQFQAVIKHRLEGMSPGASDIIIPGQQTFVCEVKRKDITRSKWQDGQQAYLKAALDAGCFACVALGAEAAWMAFEEWIGANDGGK